MMVTKWYTFERDPETMDETREERIEKNPVKHRRYAQ
jgi:hypothetical protein